MENERYDLLRRMVRCADAGDGRADLSALETIIMETLPDLVAENAPPDFPELYFALKQEFERFREYILYEPLSTRHIVALGGGQASGKSSFLNAITGEAILPAGIDPAASVPTYLIHGETAEACGINLFRSLVPMQPADVLALAHGFDAQDETPLTLGHLFTSLLLSTPRHPFGNLALLDTPGIAGAGADARIARSRLQIAGFILWFVDAGAGPISESDIRFLRTIRQEIPKLVIVSKADCLSPEALDMVIGQTRETLERSAIHCLDVLPFSGEEPEGYGWKAILHHMQLWNDGTSRARFAHNFQDILQKCREHYERLLSTEESVHSRMVQIVAELSDEYADAADYLTMINNRSRRSITETRRIAAELRALQQTFFAELQKISEQTGLDLTEPQAAELTERTADPLQVLQAYSAANGLDTTRHKVEQNRIAVMLTSLFERFEPVFNEKQGAGLQRQFAGELEQLLHIPAEKVRINHCMEPVGDALYTLLHAALESTGGTQNV